MSLHFPFCDFVAKVRRLVPTLLLPCILANHAFSGIAPINVPTSGEGSSFTTVPFGEFASESSTLRYQQVYDGWKFTGGLSAGPGILTVFAFRLDEFAGRPINDTLANVQINFSTTSRSENNLSMVFSENIGPDDTVAFASGPLTLHGIYFNGSSPQPWEPEMAIPLSTPFHYDPRLGNLLMDIRVFQGSGRLPRDAIYFDAFDLTGDGISRVWSDGVNELVATRGDTIGLTTYFIFETIPEPRTTTLFGVGLLGLAILWRRTFNRISTTVNHQRK